ncbi:hypothetical protein JW911_02700 [Candidatus Peregrinibacteria bacterium]|nr:hypothetical protein [Candidatus Peregrinibacteria bacterium]
MINNCESNRPCSSESSKEATLTTIDAGSVRSGLRAKIFALGLAILSSVGFGCRGGLSCLNKEVVGCSCDPHDSSDNNNNLKERYRYKGDD